MKNQLTILFFLLSTYFGFAQEKNYKEYSYSQLFQLIEEEQDSVFILEDAIIKYNEATDTLFATSDLVIFSNKFSRTDTIVIDKELKFSSVFFQYSNQPNVRFQSQGILNHIKFLKPVEFFNSTFYKIVHATFYDRVRIDDDESFYQELEDLNNSHRDVFTMNWFRYCHFKKGLSVFLNSEPEKPKKFFFEVYNSIIETTNKESKRNHTLIRIGNHSGTTFINNVFKGPGNVRFITNPSREFKLVGNKLMEQGLFLIIPKDEVEELIITNNTIGKLSSVQLENNSSNYNIGWKQFSGKIADWNNYNHYTFLKHNELKSEDESSNLLFENPNRFFDSFLDRLRIQDEGLYKGEIAFRSKFLKMYQDRHDTDLYNLVFNEIKDLETERLEYLYETNPKFKTFFTWKTNQFLKVFSAYGTEPARAIIYSVYVILIFGFIYLFFPNSWDKHGKNRIVDRYNFFFKYMKRKAGIHEVYLDEQKEELMSYDQFKDNISSSSQKVPKFFTATALPLYKWAISGTKLSASLLKRVDIMKGTWSELPQHKRIWKSVLLIGAFTIAVLYDIFIKMLNALMLSINTFTTLGFGEIPIKGLPRYLAIIQGFIGWFMLTIFSVSLISQLLN